jgi:hypothetical protein
LGLDIEIFKYVDSKSIRGFFFLILCVLHVGGRGEKYPFSILKTTNVVFTLTESKQAGTKIEITKGLLELDRGHS